jgi:hypothetical protein
VAKKAASGNGSNGNITNHVALPALQISTFKIKLVGDSSLICNRFSNKAKQQMRDKQRKAAKQAKEARDPEADYQNSLYKMDKGKYGFPVIGFKSAAVDACSHAEGITKVEARGAFHIKGDLAEINGTPNMREDSVRIQMNKTDLRYRGEFKNWSTTLEIRHNKNVLSVEQIINLFNIAGFAIGVGEWRPQKDGSFGMFHVE